MPIEPMQQSVDTESIPDAPVESTTDTAVRAHLVVVREHFERIAPDVDLP